MVMQLNYSYTDAGSPLHRLNAAVWVAWVAASVTAALVLDHPLALGSVLAVSPVVASAAGVRRQWWGVVKFAAWMFLFVVVINVIVSNEGSHVLWTAGVSIPLVGQPRVTLEAIAFGAAMGVRLTIIISAFTLLNLCVHPDDLMQAAIKARLPYRSVLVTSLSTRFIPVLFSDANTIMDVQRSRGVDFAAGGFSGRVRSYGALVLPLLSNSLDRAVQVAEAMESRGYGARGRRTFFRDRPVQHVDVLAVVALVAALSLAVAMTALGIDSFAYYPALSGSHIDLQLAVSCCLLLVLFVSPVPVALLAGRSADD